MMVKFRLYLIALILIQLSVAGQDFPYELPQYEFIKYEDNVIEGSDSLLGIDKFYQKWRNLVVNGTGNIEILHIGDSHIQADFFTGQVRNRIQAFFPGLEGARGFVFPYNLAGINNPFNYSISSPNKWESILSTKVKQDTSFGLSGVILSSNDTVIKLLIKQFDSLDNSGFNYVDIWYSTEDSIELRYATNGYSSLKVLSPKEKYCRIKLPTLKKEVELVFLNRNNRNNFVLDGLILDNDFPGITYHAVGLNGATAESFNRCENFPDQLSRLSPDLIILSLGTNDIYALNPSMDNFIIHYGKLVQMIRNVFPNTAFVLTTPGDHFIQGYLPNEKVKSASGMIKELGVKFEAGVWDFYHIMGGFRSMMAWRANGLGSKDKVHLSKTGYVLQGNLFFNALLKGFEPYLTGNKENE